MTRGAFLAAVQSAGIRPDAYSFDVARNECYVLAAHGDAWDVYYSERGLQTGLRHFEAESPALEHLLGLLRKDRSTKL